MEKRQTMNSVSLMGDLLDEGQNFSSFDDSSYQGFLVQLQTLGLHDGGEDTPQHDFSSDEQNYGYGQGMVPGMWRS